MTRINQNRRKPGLSILFAIVWLVTGFSVYARHITKGPWLADPGARSMTIRWESNVKTSFSVDYGKNPMAEKTKTATLLSHKNNKWLYETVIDGLKPGVKYFYRIVTGNMHPEIYSFRTIAPQAPLTFAVLGDSRSKPGIFSALVSLINAINPGVIVANGDLVARGGNEQQWQSQFFDPAASMINHIPFLSAVGDHESDSVDGDYASLFTQYLFPHKDSMKLWFSYDVGEAHFVFLDWRYPYDPEMIGWFKKDMENNHKTWQFVVMHRPPYNLGGHHTVWGKNVWPDLFEKYHVDIVFSGHSHLYERFRPVKPLHQDWAVTYITTGGAGAPLYEAMPAPALAYTRSVNHFLKVVLDKNRISLYAIGINGGILDSVSWTKKNEKICLEYRSTAIPKEELDIINVFNEPISQRMNRLPMVEVPYSPVLKLDATHIPEDVSFTIRLAEKSQDHYKMKPVTGVLKAGTLQEVALMIYGRATLTVTKWGDLTPPLRLVARYKTKRFQGRVTGKRLEYIAW